jgi:Spy/CpxP family protein refolding chaperone
MDTNTKSMKRILSGVAVLLLLTVTAKAQPDSAKKHPHGAYHQMNLTADQRAKLKTLREEFKHKAYGLRNEPLPEEERKTKMQALHKEHRASMEAILTPAQKQQLTRIKEVHKGSWKEGNRLNGKMHKPAEKLQEELNLTTEQQAKLKAIRVEYKTKMQSVYNDQALSETAKRSKLHELKKAQRQEQKTVLTKEQAEKLQALRHEHAAGRTR